MRFFTSDTHFGHANIIKYCNRPFKSVSHMNQAIIENWNNVVGPDDTVYHLGDVALGPWEDWDNSLSQLNGHITLVIGNHDRVFEGAYNEKQRTRFAPVYRQWFERMEPSLITMISGTEVNLSHFPYEADHMENARYMEYRLKDEGRTLIHGHTHLDEIVSRSVKGTLQIHVGMDAWNYTPVSEEQLAVLLESQEV